MSRYFCIGIVDFMLIGRRLLEYTNLWYHSDYEKNDKVMLKYFQSLKRQKNHSALFPVSIENLKNLKCHTF